MESRFNVISSVFSRASAFFKNADRYEASPTAGLINFKPTQIENKLIPTIRDLCGLSIIRKMDIDKAYELVDSVRDKYPDAEVGVAYGLDGDWVYTSSTVPEWVESPWAMPMVEITTTFGDNDDTSTEYWYVYDIIKDGEVIKSVLTLVGIH